MLRVLASLAILGAVAELDAQTDSVTVVAGPQYRAGGLEKKLLGKGYRELWTAPIRVEVLDVESFAGGLHPLRRGGGRQTVTLHFEGTSGRRYIFRSVDKDLAVSDRLGTGGAGAVRGLVQDVNSAMYPAAPIVATALQCAVGILCALPRLVVMPDHPALGEHREEFAGMLGTIEERPNEGEDGALGIGGFTRIIATERLLERLDEDPGQRVDARAYLKARLFDFLLGDWDRNQDQWRWAAEERDGVAYWVPIPRDRDFAFVDYRGLLPGLIRVYRPQVVRFDAVYRDLFGLTVSSSALDRRFLAELAWPAWDRVTVDLRVALTDAAITAAARGAPPEYHAFAGERLIRTLRQRRDLLSEASRHFYEQLSTEVDIHTTDAADIAEVVRPDHRTVEVRVFARGDDPDHPVPEPYFRRTFARDETREVRVLLGGDNDRGRVSGQGTGLVVRLVGGDGDDVLVDSTRAAVRGKAITMHDSIGADSFVAPPSVRVDRRPFHPPGGTTLSGERYRDWGWGRRFVPTLDHEFGAGLILGGGVDFDRYGFRRAPFAYRLGVRGAYATGARDGALRLRGEFHRVNSDEEVVVRAQASRIESLRYYGFGNESPALEEIDALTFQRQLLLEPSLRFPVSGAWLSLGPVFRWTEPELEPGTPLARDRPYGSTAVGKVGARARLDLDRRSEPVMPRRGFALALQSMAYPAAWDVERAFGKASSSISAWLPLPAGPRGTMILRAGGERAWGRYPVQEAAFLGGSPTLHGYPSQRFAGDAAVFGTVAVRTPLLESLPAAGTLGAHVLAEVGRVFLAGESSGRWHPAVGAGLWYRLEVAGRAYAPGFTYARGELGRVYFHLRAPF